jgi:hypothetical protein
MTVYFSPEMARAVRIRAIDLGSTVSDVVNAAVQDALSRTSEPPGTAAVVAHRLRSQSIYGSES